MTPGAEYRIQNRKELPLALRSYFAHNLLMLWTVHMFGMGDHEPGVGISRT